MGEVLFCLVILRFSTLQSEILTTRDFTVLKTGYIFITRWKPGLC